MPIKKGRSDKVVSGNSPEIVGKSKPKKIRDRGVVRTVKKRDGNYPVKIY